MDSQIWANILHLTRNNKKEIMHYYKWSKFQASLFRHLEKNGSRFQTLYSLYSPHDIIKYKYNVYLINDKVYNIITFLSSMSWERIPHTAKFKENNNKYQKILICKHTVNYKYNNN